MEGSVARRALDEMTGEALREVGIPIFVFAILDRLVADRITWKWTVVSATISFVFFLGGCYIERTRYDA